MYNLNRYRSQNERRFRRTRGNNILNFIRNNRKLISVIGLTAAIAIANGHYNKKDDNLPVYEARLTDKKDVTLFDETGKVLKTFPGEDGIENIIFLQEKIKDKNKRYQVIVREEDGNMIVGYIEGKDISKKSEKIKGFDASENFGTIFIVSASNGVYVRENKKIDRNTDKASILPEGTYVLGGIKETSKDNAYTWRKVIYFDGDEAKTGYMANEYLLDINKLTDNRTFRVQSKSLRLRDRASTEEGLEITKMKQNEKVYIIPNVSGVQTEKYDWLYVAYENKETGELELGWAAATERTSDGRVINHLIDTEEIYEIEDVEEIEEIEDIENAEEVQTTSENDSIGDARDTQIKKIVDTSSAKHADLKLREEPGTDKKIIFRIQDGSTIYVTQRYMDECEESEEVDGFKWIKVYLENGESGYVAEKYLKDVEEKNLKDVGKNFKKTTGISIHEEGKIDGYLGIDVAPDVFEDIGNFERILNGELSIPKASIKNLGDTPNFIYIKAGATGYGNKFSIAPGTKETEEETAKAREERQDEVKSYIRKCEEYKIPYGLYYYSQAKDKKETDQEIEYIKEIFKGMGELEYNVLPFAIDIENLNGRMGKYAKQSEENKRRLTAEKEEMMEELREELGKEVIFYSDHNALVEIIDYTRLSEENKKDMWVVDYSSTHSEDLVDMGLESFIGNRQVDLDVKVEEINKSIDINFMNAEVFERYIQAIDTERQVEDISPIQEDEQER